MSESRLVYSTANAGQCADCGRALKKCRCLASGEKQGSQSKSTRPQLRIEKKGRGGKTVSVISLPNLSEPQLKAVAKRLKALCGSGGTVKKQVIEIQGDHREKLQRYVDEHFPN